MPIATPSRTRLGPWGVSQEPYGAFTGRGASVDQTGGRLYIQGSVERVLFVSGSVEKTLGVSGSVEKTLSMLGSV